MNCITCIKAQPIPSCLEDAATFLIGGVTFPGIADGEIITIRFKDLATGRIDYIRIELGTDPLDLSAYFPLMSHYYEIDFLYQGSNAQFLLTSPDGSETIGCCLEFTVNEGLTWYGGAYGFTDVNCIV